MTTVHVLVVQQHPPRVFSSLKKAHAAAVKEARKQGFKYEEEERERYRRNGEVEWVLCQVPGLYVSSVNLE
jgi:hypothetical protein